MTGHRPADSDVVELLTKGDLRIEGRLSGASNTTLFCVAEDDSGGEVACVYKPVRGERPLWDFPDETLGHREVATFELHQWAAASLGRTALVPTTVWRADGPLGAGACQLWIEVTETSCVDVVPSGEVPTGWLSVLRASDDYGRPLELVHRDDPRLRLMCLLDAVTNNSDRKGGHILCTEDGAIYGIDHGLCFSDDDKLRTVLWGWAGTELTETEADLLQAMVTALAAGPLAEILAEHLFAEEIAATSYRAQRLLRHGQFPVPDGRWPAIPWPAF